MVAFRYFPTFPIGARFVSEPCYFCRRTPALDGVWLDFDGDFDGPPPVCVDDLVADRARVLIPDWAREALGRAMVERHPDWDAERRSAYVADRTWELAHTPPVPWIQDNEWPIYEDDYAAFLGQLRREDLGRRHGGSAGGKAALRRIMREQRPNWRMDSGTLDAWWYRLGEFLRVYTFGSREKELYVLQTM
jgi:hypothetical protein